MRDRTALPRKAAFEAEMLMQKAQSRLKNARLDLEQWQRLTYNRQSDFRNWYPDPDLPIETRTESEAWYRERAAAGEVLVAQHQAEVTRLSPCVVAAENAFAAPTGLAPWDREAIALRLALDGAAVADVPSDLIKGAAVVERFKTALQVSRSSYFEQFRPFLRTYTLTPARFETERNYVYLVPGAHTRFERAEVEHLIAAIGRREVW